MALDTDAKRYSAIHIGSPWRGVNYFPTGTVDAAERLPLLFLGSSISAGSITFVVAWARYANVLIKAGS